MHLYIVHVCSLNRDTTDLKRVVIDIFCATTVSEPDLGSAYEETWKVYLKQTPSPPVFQVFI